MTKFYVSLHPMKEKLIIICLMCLWSTVMFSQAHVIMPDSSKNAPQKITSHRDSLNRPPSRKALKQDPKQALKPDSISADSLRKLPKFIAWKIEERTGSRYNAPMDTALYNFQQTTLPDGYAVATGHLANIGSPIISKVFFDRKEKDPFVFYDAFYPYNKNIENRIFYRMRIPYSRLNYQTAGSQRKKEERLTALMTMNFGKKFNVGVEADFIKAGGFYNSLATKHADLTFFGSYLSDRVEIHAFAAQAEITQFENGGIVDDRFITQPDSIQESFTAENIPVKYHKGWNRLKTKQFYLTGRYNLGYRKESVNKKEKGEFVPVASFILTSRYRRQYRCFRSYDDNFLNADRTRQEIDTVYKKHFYGEILDDSTRYSSFKNTVALAMREGFRPWVKFGLTAFLEHDVRNYSMIDTLKDKRMSHRENSVVIGGILNKQQGENLRFNIHADLGILGYNIGEFRAMGTIETGFNLAGKRTELSAEAYIKNLRPKYLENNYQSKYFWWNKNFGDMRRVYMGGKLFIPFTNTTVSMGVENLQNYIYFDENKKPTQESGNVQIFSVRVDQKLHFGIFNWDNNIVYQTSSNQYAIPVPLFSVYSNMYLKAKIVNELTLQFGVDAHYHTRYYAPGYEPALLQFYNQRKIQIGDFPISTLYANMHLKQTRFFLMFYNIAPRIMKPNYFSLPHYPVNPTIFKLGVSVNLHN